ncbi:MAG: type II toxin-antitoxin system RelE/ParE family toxin [Hespellia sp.]|nr:type II toxin-antitoxin system RelE/ParE family toxin [Hespellia sp.]
MYQVKYYKKENGSEPVKDFLDQLPLKMQSKAMATIEILEEFGVQLREPYSKPIGNGLFELRIKFASDISRIFFFFYSGNNIILTNGFIKKAGKLSSREKKKAMSYKQDYERRYGHDKF